MTYRQLYDYGVTQLTDACIEEAALDARILLEYICHTDRNALLVYGNTERSIEEEDAYKKVISKRSERIPLQHITGEQAFMGLRFQVNEHTLIPRQDTEILVEQAGKHLKSDMRILDMCTGSGCILLSLLKYYHGCTGVGVDLSEKALEIAKTNAQSLEINADFVQSDLFANVEGKFDMIVSNPPYIKTAVIETLMPEVREHEPMQALDGFEDGLYFYKKIVEAAKDFLYNGSWLLFEIGYDQAQEVSELMEKAGFQQIEVIKDYAGLNRVVKGLLVV